MLVWDAKALPKVDYMEIATILFISAKIFLNFSSPSFLKLSRICYFKNLSLTRLSSEEYF
jgi:hypothetical protein